MKYVLSVLLLCSLAVAQVTTVGSGTLTIPTCGTTSCVTSTPATDDFTAEKLTDCEVSSLEKARSAFTKAKQELDGLEQQIKIAHGDSGQPYGLYNCMSYTATTVELRGKWALITKTPNQSCVTLTGSGGSGWITASPMFTLPNITTK